MAVIGAAGVILVLIMTVVLLRTSKVVSEDAEKYAAIVCKENAAWASDYVDEKIGSLKTTAYCFESQEGMGDLKFDLYKNMIDRIIKDDSTMYAMWYIEDFRMSDSSLVQKHIAGVGVSGKSAELFSLIEKDGGYLQAKQNNEMVISEPLNVNGTWVVSIAMPYSSNGKVVGVVGYLLKTDFLNSIVVESMDSKDVACKIITNNGNIAAHPNKANIGQKLNEGDQTDEIVESIKSHTDHMSYSYSATFGEEAYKVFTPIDFSMVKEKWSFCTMVPKSMITHKTNMLILLLLVLLVLGLGFLAITTNAIAKLFTDPIIQTSKELSLIAEGRLDETQEVNIHSNDEIGEMVNGLNLLLVSQKQLAYFANEVGNGNLDAAIEAKSDKDIIGKAMVEMKQNLIVARDAEEQRRYEDKIQDWKFEGTARIHETIRKENASIKHLCDSILHEVIGYTGSIQGGIFVINDDQMDERYVELVSCIAYNRKKMMVKRLAIDEGLIGRCIYEKAPIVLSEIPQDYLSITSGLGDNNPNYLVIMPLINNEQIVGVIEVAAFKEMESHVVDYLGKTAESLASAISNVNINERTQRLLDKTKEYAEETGAQEEELRQNMEEMQASQEEMHRKSQEYEETILSLRAELGDKQ